MINAKNLKTVGGAIAVALLCSIAVYQFKAHTKGIADDK